MKSLFGLENRLERFGASLLERKKPDFILNEARLRAEALWRASTMREHSWKLRD